MLSSQLVAVWRRLSRYGLARGSVPAGTSGTGSEVPNDQLCSLHFLRAVKGMSTQLFLPHFPTMMGLTLVPAEPSSQTTLS